MKKIWMILCLAVMAMFLVSCQPGKAVSTAPYRQEPAYQRLPYQQVPYAIPPTTTTGYPAAQAGVTPCAPTGTFPPGIPQTINAERTIINGHVIRDKDGNIVAVVYANL